jgi:ATP-dependent RNA helicase RhlE
MGGAEDHRPGAPETVYSLMPFQQLGLHPELARALKALNYTQPTPIQAQAIPLALTGKDVLGCAQTGSGKTAAFVLPMLHRFLAHPKPGLRGLVLVPTRELAVQVERAVRDYSKFAPVQAAVVIGGVGYGNQTDAVRRGAQILVATPGRLLDHLNLGNFNLDKVDYLVLDEADRMLDMGFLPDIKRILAKVPRERQTMLFSATLHPEVERIAAFATHQPARVEIARPTTVAEGISQIVYPVVQSQKSGLLFELLKATEMRSVLVFTRTKHGADRVAKRLAQQGYKTGVLHGNRSQNQRNTAMDDFRHGRTQILVATDIAARGIDVKNISHVVNFDVPRHTEDYVHRVGRTGRAYGVGDAVTFVDREEEPFLRDIEKFIGITFPRAVLPSFQYNNPPRNPAPPTHGGQHHGQHHREHRPPQDHRGSGRGQPQQPQRPQNDRRRDQPRQGPSGGFSNPGGYGSSRRRNRFRRRFGR